ncbi:MAG: rRNA maturation RNase YbeY [Candidatus Moranbacteria bacterium]|nr:rRNA maturation RNase YbeY [Candidatus Moranbacteria bacterium]
MRVIVHLAAEVATPFSQSFLTEVVEETLKRCPMLPANAETITLNAIAVSGEKIRELNQTYRGKDTETDILSFGEYTDSGALISEQQPEIFLGELFFCQDFITQAAAEDGITLVHEMIYIFSHGVLHLLGYDHSNKMFAIQDAVTEHLRVKCTYQ